MQSTPKFTGNYLISTHLKSQNHLKSRNVTHLKKTYQVKEGQVKETTAITFTNLGQMALVILLTS